MKPLLKRLVVSLAAVVLSMSLATPAGATRKAEEGTIQGSVIGPRGHLIGGARVRIRRDSGRRAKVVRTGPKGHFESNHMPGRFAIRASKRGVGHSSTMHVYLAGGQTINLPSIYIFPHRRYYHYHRHILGVGRPRASTVVAETDAPPAAAQSPAPAQQPAKSAAGQAPVRKPAPNSPIKSPGGVRGT